MRDDRSLDEKLQQEEALPPQNIAEDQPHNIDTDIVSHDDTPSQEQAGSEEQPMEARGADGVALRDTNAVPYHERFYLKYREGKRSTALDLNGTRSFLRELGFDGGELRQAREGKNCAESFRNADNSKNNQMYCSYCGSEIAGVEFFRLPDGRMRCTTCSNSVVTTKAEVEELCQRVIENMDSFFGATIEVPISIEVVDERKLKKKIGLSLGTKDAQSLLILGVAINKKNKYSIILENAPPRISLIATFAHELTHIWQYTHWDNKKNFKKCPKNMRLLIYEGMAKWAEIQYLYLIGETNAAKREEYITRNRQDEYGVGFRLYEDQYPLSREAMACDDTPFLPDRYPLD
ncbi:MAG: hypothetical protein IJD10_05870 [Clostridia bacterium]|nr:hypothetical protein [Clostridia bacterium]